MPENNEVNREKLVQEIVDGWDMDTLMGYALDNLTIFYRDNSIDFQAEWETMFGDSLKEN